MIRAICLAAVLLFLGSPGHAQSIEYKLAVIDADGHVEEDDITVARFRSLLNQLESKYKESEQQIADMTVKGRELMREEGIDEKMLAVMEGLNQIVYSTELQPSYAEFVAAYVVMRNGGHSHTASIEGLRGILGLAGGN